MKTVKIMLMVIALMAIGGGILAFKKLTPVNYCTTLPVTTEAGGPLVCSTLGLPLVCGSAAVNTVLTSDVWWFAEVCYTFADQDSKPCMDGSQFKRCPNRARYTIEIE